MYLTGDLRIALITQNKATNPNRKTTLIVAPLALVDQWKMEIDIKTNEHLKCLIYHGEILVISPLVGVSFDWLIIIVSSFGYVL